MLHCFHQQYSIFYTTANIVISAQSLCTLSAPLCDSPYLWSRNISFLRHGETRFGRAGDLVRAAVLRFGCCGRLLPGPLSSDRPGHGGWWGGGVLRSVRLVERAGAAEAAAQRPPVLLTLPAQPAADPQPHLVSTLQQEVHQLHVRSGGTCAHTQN